MEERIDWEFNKENHQKKSIGRSASKRCGRNRKGCTLPSDKLTPAQRKKLNGEVICVNMNKPCRWAEFKLLSKDLQEKYINSLNERFGATYKDISLMFGVAYQTFKGFVDSRALSVFAPNPGHRLNDPTGWEAFKKGLLTVEQPEEEPVEDIFMPDMSLDHQDAITQESLSEHLNMPKPSEVKAFEHFDISFNGVENLDQIATLIKNLPWADNVRIRIEVGKTRLFD